MLVADRGYHADWIRDLPMKIRRMGQHPAKKQSQRSDLLQPYLNRTRNRVERFLNRIKQCRRVATRYDKLAANYIAFVQLASIRLSLRINESAPYSRGTEIRVLFQARSHTAGSASVKRFCQKIESILCIGL
jgi:transposase